jgi:integrase
MFSQAKELAGGRVKWYIRYKNEKGKVVYLDKSRYPDFWSKADADEWINEHRQDFVSIKKNADILREIKAKKKYPDFQKLLDMFEVAQKEDAENSWESSMNYMTRFIMDFYFNRKAVRDVNEWHKYFEEFRDYLRDEATVFGEKKIISYATKNHCIRTLNKFLTVMARRKVLKSRTIFKCRTFHKDKLNTRGLEAVFTEDDYNRLLAELNEETRVFFQILYQTGMRFNELYSMDMESILFKEEAPDYLVERFKTYNVNVYGYLTLSDQLKGPRKFVKTNENRKGEFVPGAKYERKALKGYKGKPKSEHKRIIPILDKDTWKLIKECYDKAWDIYDVETAKGNKSENVRDYFLIECGENTVRREFQRALKKLNISDKNFHSCRHTRITLWVGSFKFDPILVKNFSGHRSDSFERYLHLYQQMSEEVTKKKSENRRRRRPNLKQVV